MTTTCRYEDTSSVTNRPSTDSAGSVATDITDTLSANYAARQVTDTSSSYTSTLSTGPSNAYQILMAFMGAIDMFQEMELAWSDVISNVADKETDLENEEIDAMSAAYDELGDGKNETKDQQACTNIQTSYDNQLAPLQQEQSTYSTLEEQLSTEMSQVTSYITSVAEIFDLIASLIG